MQELANKDTFSYFFDDMSSRCEMNSYCFYYLVRESLTEGPHSKDYYFSFFF